MADSSAKQRLRTLLPILEWAPRYRRGDFSADAIAALIVTVLLIPQSLAYAMLAGLPPAVGLYASILPLVAYTLLGTSRTLSVGPVAVVALMTASALAPVAEVGSERYVVGALALAFMSGAVLLVMGLLRFGFVVNFLPHPVIAGFVTASAILIALGQARHLLGIEAHGHDAVSLATSLVAHLRDTSHLALVVGGGTLLFLVLVRRFGLTLLAPVLRGTAPTAARLAPAFAVVIGTLASAQLDLGEKGLTIVGAVPSGMMPFAWPSIDASLWVGLAPAAVLIALIGFVESVSVGQALAARRRQSIEPDAELRALGAANIASGLSGGMAVTGGFSRSVVNFDAGARTPAAGAFAALGLLLTTLYLTDLVFHLPVAVLAATIVVAVLGLVDLKVPRRLWRYSRFDFTAWAVTVVVTLFVGVEIGVACGVACALLLLLWRSSHPHIAVVGRVPGTQHFRNVRRHDVECCPQVLAMRIDASLTFANARAVEVFVQREAARHPEATDVVLQMSAVNAIDASALESLERVMERLASAGVTLHLSEVKGPVMDALAETELLEHLTGRIFLSHHAAILALDPAKEEPSDLDQRSAGEFAAA